jgi:hypothetical protein
MEAFAPNATRTGQIHTIRRVQINMTGLRKTYIGQTSREFRTRFNEHKRAFHHNSQQSKFALHLTEHKHSFGHIHNTMEIIHLQKKGKHLNTIAKFHVYKEARKGNHLNDDLTVTPTNKIFDTIVTHLT